MPKTTVWNDIHLYKITSIFSSSYLFIAIQSDIYIFVFVNVLIIIIFIHPKLAFLKVLIIFYVASTTKSLTTMMGLGTVGST